MDERPPRGGLSLLGRWTGLALVAAAVLGARAADGAASPPGRAWRDGPVRYLLTEDEYRRYGRLRTPEARESWVGRFWRRLDPDPATPDNEFEERWTTRVREAERYREPLTPGWRTDRGRVHLLAGPPTSVRRDTLDARAVEREIWTYGWPEPSARGPVEIVFYRDSQGRFRLDPVPPRTVLDASGAAEFARGMRSRRVSPGSVQRIVDSVLQQQQVQRSVALSDPPRLSMPFHPTPPPAPPTLPAAPPSGLRSGTWFFQAADGSVLAVFAVDLDEGGPGAGSEAAVWIWEAGAIPGGTGSVRIPLEPAAPAAGLEEGRRLWTGRVYLEPGPYEVRYAVADPARGTLAVHGEPLDVPELGSGDLTASSVVPAERFGPAQGNVFAVGSEEVVPRPGAVFRRSELLRLYFQVYGARPDPRSGRARVDVRVRFERAGGSRRRHGRPFVVREAAGASMGLALPVGDWPLGDYRVRVGLHDRVSGHRAETLGSFRIAD